MPKVSFQFYRPIKYLSRETIALCGTVAGRGEADHQNWKAAKALLVIIPLLGITYLITILGK
jgi:hypothetical protein